MHITRGLAAAAATTAVALAVAGCAGAPAATPSAGADLPDALQGTLVNPVLIYPPYGLIDENGEYSGISTDIAVLVADELGVELTQEEAAWENILSGVQSGKYLWYVGGEITPERLEVYDWVWVENAYANFPFD